METLALTVLAMNCCVNCQCSAERSPKSTDEMVSVRSPDAESMQDNYAKLAHDTGLDGKKSISAPPLEIK
jgi:hypothetical protein